MSYLRAVQTYVATLCSKPVNFVLTYNQPSRQFEAKITLSFCDLLQATKSALFTLQAPGPRKLCARGLSETHPGRLARSNCPLTTQPPLITSTTMARGKGKKHTLGSSYTSRKKETQKPNLLLLS